MPARTTDASRPRLDLLSWQFDVATGLLDLYLDGLEDDECLWAPGADCLTVRPQPDGRWVADWPPRDIGGVAETDDSGAEPMTSIAWLLWHIGVWWTQTYDDTFGSGRRLAPTDVDWPGDAEASIAWLRELRKRWAHASNSLQESDLDSSEHSTWFLRGTRPLGFVLAWVNSELMKNTAEIGVARRLYSACRG